jgi:phosphoadenosine phosphosulfate reductase
VLPHQQDRADGARALKPYAARIASLRRDSSPERAKIKILEERTDKVILVHPLANWSREQLKQYLKDHDVPVHPLHDKGYKTIGCFPTCCTVPVGENAPERAGRWTGTGKSECGLHMVGIRRPAQDFSI